MVLKSSQLTHSSPLAIETVFTCFLSSAWMEVEADVYCTLFGKRCCGWIERNRRNGLLKDCEQMLGEAIPTSNFSSGFVINSNETSFNAQLLLLFITNSRFMVRNVDWEINSTVGGLGGVWVVCIIEESWKTLSWDYSHFLFNLVIPRESQNPLIKLIPLERLKKAPQVIR